jgi:hypothetical protein
LLALGTDDCPRPITLFTRTMHLLTKIITAVLTTLYSVAALLTLWSLLRLQEVPVLSYDPRFLASIGILGFVLTVYYSNHLAENQDVQRISRVLWFIRFYLLSFVAFPIYWIAFILRSTPTEDWTDGSEGE